MLSDKDVAFYAGGSAGILKSPVVEAMARELLTARPVVEAARAMRKNNYGTTQMRFDEALAAHDRAKEADRRTTERRQNQDTLTVRTGLPEDWPMQITRAGNDRRTASAEPKEPGC